MATPGEHQTIRGIEVVAIAFDGHPNTCNACAFASNKNFDKGCNDVKCHGVLWLTPLDYVAHRLTGETT
jgi:hypothetical protein